MLLLPCHPVAMLALSALGVVVGDAAAMEITASSHTTIGTAVAVAVPVLFAALYVGKYMQRVDSSLEGIKEHLAAQDEANAEKAERIEALKIELITIKTRCRGTCGNKL